MLFTLHRQEKIAIYILSIRAEFLLHYLFYHAICWIQVFPYKFFYQAESIKFVTFLSRENVNAWFWYNFF